MSNLKGRVLVALAQPSTETLTHEDIISVIQQEIFERLQEEMKKKIVKFEYRKTSDGSIRQAFGTTCQDFIPKYKDADVEKLFEEARDFHCGFGTGTLIQGDDEKLGNALKPFGPKEFVPRTPNPDFFNYYDLGSGGFRKFKIDQLLTVYI